jgi:restriction endonuclease Mrr
MAAPDFQTLMKPVLDELADGQERASRRTRTMEVKRPSVMNPAVGPLQHSGTRTHRLAHVSRALEFR